MIWAGLITGLAVYTVNLFLVVLVLRKAEMLPEEDAPKYIAMRYYLRYAVLVVVLGVLVWLGGLQFALGTMGGLVLAKVILLAIGSQNKGLIARLIKGSNIDTPGEE